MFILTESSSSPAAAAMATTSATDKADAGKSSKSSLYKWRSYFQKRKAKQTIGLHGHCAVEVLGNATYERTSKDKKMSMERVIGVCNGYLIAFKPRGESLKWQDLDVKFNFARRAVKSDEDAEYTPLVAKEVTFFTDPTGRRVIVRGRTREQTIPIFLTGNQTFAKWENKLRELEMSLVKYDADTFDCVAEADHSTFLKPAPAPAVTPAKAATASPRLSISGTIRLGAQAAAIAVADAPSPSARSTPGAPNARQIMVRQSADNSVLVRRVAFEDSLPSEQLDQLFNSERRNQPMRQSTAW
eukprot:Opistho-1_new@61536